MQGVPQGAPFMFIRVNAPGRKALISLHQNNPKKIQRFRPGVVYPNDNSASFS